MPLEHPADPYAWYFSSDFALVVAIALVTSIILTKLVKNLSEILEDRWVERIFWVCSFIVCTIITNIAWVALANPHS